MQTYRQEPTRQWYRISEAADEIRVCRRTIERWIASGSLRATRVNRLVLIPAADVRALTAIEA